MAEELQRELHVDTAFTVPIFGGIEIYESVVITWLIMAVLVALAIWLTRGLKVQNPGKRQVAAEYIVTWLDQFTAGMLGEKGKQYGPYLATVLIYIGFANLIGIFGFKPPTKDLNVTVALALMSIILIEAAGIRARGPKKWLRSFAEPVAVVTPINVMEIFIRPLSLCMRLFGNVIGSFVIMELIKMLIPVGVPLVFSFYFDIFDGLIQAYVFVFLTSLFIQEAVE
ncbi:MAG: F0F1 ATP synthase subunit A [Eubacteriales bacterium]|nr:F0F1 ATP synthase subunit A [Eubacteriales bacterium]